MSLLLDQFQDRLLASGLISETDLKAFVNGFPEQRRPQDGEQLARLLVKKKKLTAYQAQQVYSGKGKSLTLSNYVVLDKLGHGGMGVVLMAEHRRMKRVVALKVLSPTVTKTPEALSRFQREVEAAAKLHHPNIVTAFDADEANGTNFLVMEYVSGKDLSAVVKEKGPLRFDEAVACILQAAKGLQYAHEQGVVHRDIKPANLMLDAKGTVKILDMGLARLESSAAAPDQAELTSTGQIMGSVDYMAPEQALSTKTADARSDIYSLGISLWYLMTAKAAHDGESLTAKLLAHQQAPIPSLTEACPDAPAELDAVFQKLVAKKPDDRYQSMSEVLADLESFPAPEPSAPSLIAASSEDSKLSDFLKGLEGQPRTPVQDQPTEQLAATDFDSADLDTDPQTQASLRPVPPTAPPARKSAESPPLWQNRKVQIGAAGLVLFLLAAAATVFFFQTPHGTLRVQINDPQIEVSVKGTDIVLKGAKKEAVTLAQGAYVLHVKRGDLEFDTKSLQLKAGETVVVKVELLDGEVQVASGGKVIGSQAASKRPARDRLRKVLEDEGVDLDPWRNKAIEFLEKLKEHRQQDEESGHHTSPQTTEQIEFVKTWREGTTH